MSEVVIPAAEWCALVLEVLGLVVIVSFTFISLLFGAVGLAQRQSTEGNFGQVRQGVGRGILLGLEFLVAADIVHTVAIELTFQSIGVLALIVLVRTFLSFTLEVELTGKWPWQKSQQP